MTRFILALLLTLPAAPWAAETTDSLWKEHLASSLGFSQAYFDNWRAGGVDNLAWTANLDGGATREVEAWSLENNLKLAYGMLRNDGEEPRKSADSIHADSTYTRKLTQWVNPFAGVTWDTQFYTGFQYPGPNLPGVPVSKFMDPGYLAETLGLGSAWGEVFKVRLGATARQTFTDSFPQYAADKDHPLGQRVRSEFGGSGMAALKLQLDQNLLFTSQVDVFSNLQAMDQVNVKWGNLLTAKVNGWLSTNLNVDMLYDPTVSSQRQLKEGMSLTISYLLL